MYTIFTITDSSPSNDDSPSAFNRTDQHTPHPLWRDFGVLHSQSVSHGCGALTDGSCRTHLCHNYMNIIAYLGKDVK